MPRLGYVVVALFLASVPAMAGAAGMATGAQGAVAAEHRLASQAGVEVLRRGGNAVDAAVAAVLVTGVVNPSSSGLGGGGFLVVYRADGGRSHTIDFRERAPAAATRGMYVRNGRVDRQASLRGALAVAVPGEVAGLARALERFGSMSFAEVAEPAIRMAREGFVVEEHLARMIAAFRDAIIKDRALASIFLHADGTPVGAGEILKRPGLAHTLELLATEGPRAFYEGLLAEEIVATIGAAGGIVSAEDLASYEPVERPPVVVEYRKWKVLGMPPPSSGGGVSGEALNVLEPYRPRDLGHNSATYLHILAETLKAAFADRAQWYGDSDFVRVPLDRFLSPSHAAAIRTRIRATSVVPASAYGKLAAARGGGTSHISVVDAAGNAVACTSSINTPFGAMLAVPGRGIVLNNTMDDFSAQPGVPNAYGLIGSEANAIAPRKRPLSSMAPTIVVGDDGRVRLVVGASGGPRIISATLQVVLNVLEFSMDVGRAVEAPRIHHQWIPDEIAVEAGIKPSVRAQLERLGHRVVDLPHGASVQAIEVVTRENERRVRAMSDPRKGGQAAAY